MEKHTPLMVQYHEIKAEYADALVLFQVGDFYEIFFEDAKRAAAYLGIALTKRGKDAGQDIPLCGVPLHTIDHYLTKLIKGGFSVVIVDQLEPARPGKMVKRGVTQVLTPGTLTDSKLLDDKSASYVLSFASRNDQWALLFAELLTAQLYATTVPAGAGKMLEAELARFFPDEVLLSGNKEGKVFQDFFKKQGYFTSTITQKDDAAVWIQKNLQDSAQQIVQAHESLQDALGLFHAYLAKNNQAALSEFSTVHYYEPEDFLILDPSTQKNLELLTNTYDGTRTNTLLQTVDKAVTAMGSRTLKKWLVRPLLSNSLINHRFDAVDFLKSNHPVLHDVRSQLSHVADVERIVGRIALDRAQLQDYKQIQVLLSVLPELKNMLNAGPALLQTLVQSIADFRGLLVILDAALHDDDIFSWTIKTGYNDRLDHVRRLITHSQEALLALERQEQEATGIGSLKVRYNAIYGYYLEVTHANAHLVPARYQRKQTLVGKERYMCAELQQLQDDIMCAQNESEVLEQELFKEIKLQVRHYVSQLRKMAHALGQIDALGSFAQCAYERGYVRPVLTDDRDIKIIEGKHPVIEQALGSLFVPNDTMLTDEHSLWIITGPNMGGKSTYLRQVALTCIMAQCGSFVPAQSAQLPILDRIFTRIGASDNVAQGKSTFLVEMEETAHICQYATARSLVILDEVGRGTSTFDGLAIAQAVIEYLHVQVKVRCLFATHYHELTSLQDTLPGIASYYAVSKKTATGIVFLHKIVRGVANGSFGLDVAQLAHVPEAVLMRAKILVKEFSLMHGTGVKVDDGFSNERQELLHTINQLEQQLSYFKSIDYDDLSPKKAFDFLWKFKELQ